VTDYEVLIMLDPELAESRQQEVVDRIRTLVVEGGGIWESHTPWGRRRLAYEIDHKSEGTYHLVTFAATPETLNEVSRVLKIDDAVMRHLAVKRVKGSSTAAPAPLSVAAEPASSPGGEPGESETQVIEEPEPIESVPEDE
jgi:small subunit ribosomal protein S6